MEKKSFEFEIKAISNENETEPWIVEGYASTYDLDRGKDKIVPGAFSNSIKERFTESKKIRNGKSQIKVLWQHYPEVIIGKLLEIKEDEKGLFVKIELFNDPLFPEAAKAYKLLKLGEIFCFSIGYGINPGGSEIIELDDGEYIKLLKDLTIFEVSFVTFPMNEKSEVTNVKENNSLMSEQSVQLLKEIKGFLQEILLESKKAASEAVKQMTSMEEEEEANGKAMMVEEEMEPAGESESEMTAVCPECGEPCPNCNKGCSEEMKSEEVLVVEEAPKYITLEEVKQVVETTIKQHLDSLNENKIEKEEKNSDPIEDFMDFLLTNEFSFSNSKGN